MINNSLNNSNEINEKNYKIHLTCSKKTADMIMNDCVREFVSHHPEFKGMKISQGFILKKLKDFYLEQK